MESNTEIKLVTVPKIVHKLQEVGANVTQRLKDLGIENMVATENTMKSLKALRADLNKELDDYESQRKAIKTAILNPFNEFEDVYKKEISEKYKSAIDSLKDKIAVVEDRIKLEKKEKIESYWTELCMAEKIDFYPFEKLGLDINLSTSEKAYKDKCNEVITQIIDDLNLIKTTDFEAEILTEYKTSLNAAQAITTVKTRKQKEAEEATRLHQIEVNKRTFRVTGSGMIFDELTNCYCFNDEIFVTSSFINSSSSEEFTKKIIELEEKIKLVKQSGQSNNVFKAVVISKPIVKETVKEETVTASFEVTGTMAQLQALGQYMRTNNITYKNI